MVQLPSITSTTVRGGLRGELFVYGPNRVAFESLLLSVTTSASLPHPMNKCILLGGLSDGLLPVPYTVPLSDVVCSHNSNTMHQTSVDSDNDDDVDHRQELQQQLDYSNMHHEHQQQSWSLLQPLLSSSYTGFGHGSLDRDVSEMDELIQYVIKDTVGTLPPPTSFTKSFNTNASNQGMIGAEHQQSNQKESETRTTAPKIVLIGHSTGCQQIVHYLKHGTYRSYITAAVLQAPVSDREAATIYHPTIPSSTSTTTPNIQTEQEREQQHQQQLQHYIEYAKTMKLEQNKGNEMMPREAFWAPISINRYYDLMVRYDGLDDYFSSDYNTAELVNKLSHISLLQSTLYRVIVAYSGKDEYVPKYVDTKQLTERLCDAMNTKSSPSTADTTSTTSTNIAQPFYIPNGNHNLSSSSGLDAQIFLQGIKDLLNELDPMLKG